MQFTQSGLLFIVFTKQFGVRVNPYFNTHFARLRNKICSTLKFPADSKRFKKMKLSPADCLSQYCKFNKEWNDR
jgi:hypothetical protein